MCSSMKKLYLVVLLVKCQSEATLCLYQVADGQCSSHRNTVALISHLSVYIGADIVIVVTVMQPTCER